MPSCRNCNRASRASALLALVLLGTAPLALADGQRDPELRGILANVIASSGECFANRFDAEIWYKLMEPKLRRSVKDKEERLLILRTRVLRGHQTWRAAAATRPGAGGDGSRKCLQPLGGIVSRRGGPDADHAPSGPRIWA